MRVAEKRLHKDNRVNLCRMPNRQYSSRHFRTKIPLYDTTHTKRLHNFFCGDIMRKPWGRGSVGRAMRSQRIGQGFESPRLHHVAARRKSQMPALTVRAFCIHACGSFSRRKNHCVRALRVFCFAQNYRLLTYFCSAQVARPNNCMFLLLCTSVVTSANVSTFFFFLGDLRLRSNRPRFAR